MSSGVSFISIGVGEVDRARDFYGSLFGWTIADEPSGRGAVIEGAGVPAGIHGDDPGVGPYVFFRVDDLDAALLRVVELGGGVDVDDHDEAADSVTRFGRFALCRDDQGSSFGLHEPPSGHRDDGEHARLVTVADEWARAVVSNDAARIAGFMTDDWVIVSDSGIRSKQEFLSFVESGDLTHTAMERVGDARTVILGDVGVLTGRFTNTAFYGGRRFDADEWTTDVFVRRDGRWLCLHSQITAVTPA
jgi:predicted enzyme related to lactoylglutathione lyase/ketosteroid isomerase-like protein